MKRIVVDPVNRIEGHLRLEVMLDEATGVVKDALSSGTAWRGIEVILQNRDPRDAWLYAQRICGVCTSVHALGCLRAVEDALGIAIPPNANFMRNIIAASQTVQDHLIHFYHLHSLDWISPVAALDADPAGAARLQAEWLERYALPLSPPVVYDTAAYPKDSPKATPAYFSAVRAKIRQIVDSGQLGIFAAQWWDHPDYALLPPEAHLIAVAHYLNMLDRQRDLVESHVVFGGKNPHPHYVVGGMPCSISMHDMNAPVNAARLAIVDRSIQLGIDSVGHFYAPDALAITHAYVRQGRLDGAGLAGELALGFGEYPLAGYEGVARGNFHQNLLLRSNGVVENFRLGAARAVVHPLESTQLGDDQAITEGVDHAWYRYPEGVREQHPWSGTSQPEFTAPKEGTKTDWKYLDEAGKYSWIKTPKWRGRMAEVGPAARYIVIYTKVKQGLIEPTWAERMMVEQIDAAAAMFQLPPEKWLPSTVGRTVVRSLEAQITSHINKYYFDQLIANIDAGDTSVANMEKWDAATWPREAAGVGLHEAPRGALSHWVVIQDGLIKNYQAIVPSTWNACPRDASGRHGAYETSMLNTTVRLPDKPLEILRAIHSFDPCLACATHVYDTRGRKRAVVRSDAY